MEEPEDHAWEIVRVLSETMDQFRERNPNFECPFCANLFICAPTEMLGQWGDGEIFPKHSFRCRICKQLVGFDEQTGRTWKGKPEAP